MTAPKVVRRGAALSLGTAPSLGTALSLGTLPLLLGCLLLGVALLGCGRAKTRPGTSTVEPTGPIYLNGAGATFPFPLYSKWVYEYNKINPDVRINYQSIGSGGGIRQVTAGTVDFGASDAPMEAASRAKAKGTIDHIPTTLGAVVVAYNLVGVREDLSLDAETVAAIFHGKIRKWNDPKIAATNPGVSLPDRNITVVYRSDGSGTTNVFTDYLATVSPTWKSEVGAGKSVRWPVGLGAKGNEGVTGQLQVTPGAVSYVELAYALQNRLSIVAIKNRAGQFVRPSATSVSRAAADVELSDALTASLVDSPAEGAYPIAAFTYLLVYREAKVRRKGEALARFLWWALHDGQKFAADLHYAPLPTSVTVKVEQRLRDLSFGGQPLLLGAGS